MGLSTASYSTCIFSQEALLKFVLAAGGVEDAMMSSPKTQTTDAVGGASFNGGRNLAFILHIYWLLSYLMKIFPTTRDRRLVSRLGSNRKSNQAKMRPRSHKTLSWQVAQSGHSSKLKSWAPDAPSIHCFLAGVDSAAVLEKAQLQGSACITGRPSPGRASNQIETTR
ncbi:hypothetical protein HRR83_006300 [Exophiala dermatitidis]|uniref:Uncharacterized protein n=1 Tax=Exophiala dermatitidis TaxID=5970 RepID=A0AAN6IV46_EXODE|nr:hypothetical protein HRR73_007159 [Exophiala dermatitidis]KAJ4509492.1 hypothetical protein HRR74_007273 [Exophiala dermatitidis]KAJ4530491.1 hypothetical protein HRR76_008200 [Exophiala dermatitidis]KAJ4545339.1 hypothetical protein HRR77_005186 [Exophiala dermatitidis]KAJ4570899.1 hypothetical protein HRR79_003828 [Exophiala dermatitidis]